MDIAELPPTLTIEECAVLLRLSRGSAYEAARTGQIPVIRIGRRLLVPRGLLLRMLGEGGIPDDGPTDGVTDAETFRTFPTSAPARSGHRA